MKSKVLKKLLFVFVLMMMVFPLLHSQNNGKLDKQEITKTVDTLAVVMKDMYVFPEKGQAVFDLLQMNLKNGVYDSYTNPSDFAIKLNDDVFSLTHDKHLGIRYKPEMISMMKSDEAQNTDEFDRQEKYLDKKVNFGFSEAKIIKGNIGYLKFNAFQASKEAFETAVSTMGFLANTDALIIDLRENGGGSPAMIQLISSYFFAADDERHLNTFYYRPTDSINHTYTLPYVPGKRRPDWDIYILTSRGTFSAAEEFTYNLKNMKRATIVGEITGGGAHPVQGVILTDNFFFRVAIGKAINPYTKTNWEGIGVIPDYEVPQIEAFDKALMLAYEKQMKKEKSPVYQSMYRWILDDYNAKANPVIVENSLLKSYVGTFGPRKISYNDGKLYYQREEGPVIEMYPLKENLFGFSDIDYFRLRVISEKGKVVAVEGVYDNGRVDRNDKSE